MAACDAMEISEEVEAAKHMAMETTAFKKTTVKGKPKDLVLYFVETKAAVCKPLHRSRFSSVCNVLKPFLLRQEFPVRNHQSVQSLHVSHQFSCRVLSHRLQTSHCFGRVRLAVKVSIIIAITTILCKCLIATSLSLSNFGKVSVRICNANGP